MIGRRVATVADIELPGDYSGPYPGYTGPDRTDVFFLLPIARDEGVRPEARSLHHVTSPPHVFRECADGSLEIRNSIGAGVLIESADGDVRDGGYYWHGYLDEGHSWRTV